MPKPKSGEVWLVRFPFTDLTTTKLRPAVAQAVHGEDIIVIGLFSRVPDRLRPTWVWSMIAIHVSAKPASAKYRY